MGVEIRGIERLDRALDKENFVTPLNDGIKKLTLLLDSKIKQATVVDTGRLRASITSVTGVGSFGQTWGAVGTNVNYADFIEYGTKRMGSRHMEGTFKVIGGLGMFGYGLEQVEQNMPEELDGIINDISVRVNK